MGEQIVQCDNRILEEGEGTSWWPVGEQIVRRDNRILEGARYVTICCGGLTNQISKRYMMFGKFRNSDYDKRFHSKIQPIKSFFPN